MIVKLVAQRVLDSVSLLMRPEPKMQSTPSMERISMAARFV
ncbi:hypothetical protein TELCIR_14916 [Teladorsagia circumcincta]|uniref:Uncharacterized protein n=1 Tax=Teladorsagia circumcincta TaxID=45464 RepID=A0A2G9U1A7_TELCI|nr:hypothetical protein TELCIR_14916 [Teladorsagia circumcincta]